MVVLVSILLRSDSIMFSLLQRPDLGSCLLLRRTCTSVTNLATDQSCVRAKKKHIPDTNLAELITVLDQTSELGTKLRLRALASLWPTSEDAANIVQPSWRREGFLSIPNVTWDDVGISDGKSLPFMCELGADISCMQNLANKQEVDYWKRNKHSWHGHIKQRTDQHACLSDERNLPHARSAVRGKGGIQEATYDLFFGWNNSVNTNTWCVDSAHII
ncbi:hypothetical protein FCM35_KLT07847 [Carex littledalei]|uniref:Uncharacterized protein n=1 Tax=Carex littledalei TaxID=544730 RepID=A0A833QR54_9POAL|nr:hypothetical protein FCM35_KLT07847 [Carex littledalei]